MKEVNPFFPDYGIGFKGRGSVLGNRVSGFKGRGSGIRDRGSRFGVLGSERNLELMLFFFFNLLNIISLNYYYN